MRARGWTQVRLGDLVSIRHGWPFQGELCSEQLTGNPIIVNIGNFQYTGGFRFESTTLREYRGEYPKEYELAPGDILLIMTCQTAGGEILGVPARVPDDGRTYLHNQRLGKAVVLEPEAMDPHFLYWLFRSPEFNRELYLTASGTKILHTAPSRIEAYKFYLPPRDEQRAIARIFGALDDKMELNRRMNETLEAMARAIFKSWFVDFDPVRAKAEGRRPAGMDADTAALFPATLDDSEVGEVPSRWSVVRLASVVLLSRDILDPSEYPDEVFDHYSIPAFDEDRLPGAEPGSVIRSNKFLLRPAAVLLSRLNPRIPRVWLPNMNPRRRSVCSTEFLVAEARAGVTREFLYCLLGAQAFARAFALLAGGTSGSHQRVKPDDLLNAEVVVPPPVLVARFTKVTGPVLERMGANLQESATLAAVRDALLPKLLSGQIRVREAEKVVGRHV